MYVYTMFSSEKKFSSRIFCKISPFEGRNKHTNAQSFGDFIIPHSSICGPGSLVGIATDYGLDGPGSNPGGDEIFRQSKPALGVYTFSCKMGTGSFPGVEAAGTLGCPHPL